MAKNPVDFIKSRSREEWVSSFRQKWIDIRIFIQENGELGLLAGFFLGVLFVLFFKVMFGLLILSGLLLFIGWSFAEPESERTSVIDTTIASNTSPANTASEERLANENITNGTSSPH